MKILLDENLPEGLIEPLRRLGHAVDSVGSLKLEGLDNGRPYREVAAAYDVFFTTDREFAALCLGLVVRDTDGHWLLHYLGETFQSAITHSQHADLYSMARKFVWEQFTKHQTNQDTKLAFRYANLINYFDAYPPA